MGSADIAITTRAILDGEHEIRLIVHRSDGWQFLDGGPVDPQDMAIVHLDHVLGAHPALAALLDLPQDWEAWREPGSDEWTRAALPPDLP
jgi:hypothetical protein